MLDIFLPLLATLALSFPLGFWWFSPNFLGKKWLKLAHLSENELKQRDMRPAFLSMLLGISLMSVVVSAVLSMIPLLSLGVALFTSFTLWLGLTLGNTLGSHAFAKRSWQLYWIEHSYALCVTLLAGIMSYLLS